MSLSPQTNRALRDAALGVAEAHRHRSDAIVRAHRAGAAISDIAPCVGMDAFGVRDVLARAGELPALQPKETAKRAAVELGRASRKTGSETLPLGVGSVLHEPPEAVVGEQSDSKLGWVAQRREKKRLKQERSGPSPEAAQEQRNLHEEYDVKKTEETTRDQAVRGMNPLP